MSLGTFNTDEAIPYGVNIYKLSKISGKYNRDITEREHEMCRIDSCVFKGTKCINDMLEYGLEFEGEAKRIKKQNS